MTRHHIIVEGLSESEYEAALQRKIGDGFTGERDWSDWFREMCLQWSRVPTDAESRARETGQAMLRLWVENIADNLQDIRNGKSIRDLAASEPPKQPCVLVGRGPSLTATGHPQLLKEFRDKVTVVSTDGALPILVKAGVAPDIVVSIDGNRSLVAQFYKDAADPGNPELNLRTTRLPKYTKAVLGVAVGKATAQAATQLCGSPYWFIPMWDDYRLPDSLVRVLTYMTGGTPTLRAGGNCGQCCLTLAFAILRFMKIALVGFDMGYPESTPYEQTAYYENAKNAGVNMETFQMIMTRFNHPVLGKSYADAVFKQYRKSLLDQISEMPPEALPIKNCSQGGSLFGRGIECLPFKDWLEAL